MTIQRDPFVEQVTIGVQLEQFFLMRAEESLPRRPLLIRLQARVFGNSDTWERLSMIRQAQVVR